MTADSTLTTPDRLLLFAALSGALVAMERARPFAAMGGHSAEALLAFDGATAVTRTAVRALAEARVRSDGGAGAAELFIVWPPTAYGPAESALRRIANLPYPSRVNDYVSAVRRLSIDALAVCAAADIWRDMSSAPKDRWIIVFAPGRADATGGGDDLPDIVCPCRWHDDAGFCVDELRRPTLWCEPPPPPLRGLAGAS